MTVQIGCVGLDYGGTLTSPTSAIEDDLGMRPVDPAVIRALRLLHERGLRLLIASNTQPELSRWWALRRAGVEGLFTHLVMSHQLGIDKPHPAFYAAVLRAAGCPPEHVLFVGNNLDHDVRAPMQHGMRAVHVRPHDQSLSAAPLHDGAYMIRHVNELPDLMEGLCG